MIYSRSNVNTELHVPLTHLHVHVPVHLQYIGGTYRDVSPLTKGVKGRGEYWNCFT